MMHPTDRYTTRRRSPLRQVLASPFSQRNSMPREDEAVQGVLELHTKGYGFLRNPARHYAAQPADPYVPAPRIQKLGLREGLLLAGPVEPNKKGSGPRLLRVEQIEGKAPEAYPRRNFDDLTPIAPHEQIVLETGREPLTTR